MNRKPYGVTHSVLTPTKQMLQRWLAKTFSHVGLQYRTKSSLTTEKLDSCQNLAFQPHHHSTFSAFDKKRWKSDKMPTSFAPSTHHSEPVPIKNSGSNVPELTWKQSRHVFFSAAIPMLGFGFIDQIIMIRAGELIDTTIGVTFGIATLTAAAVGQLCSDTSGALFGNSIDSILQKFGIPPPDVTNEQRLLNSFRLFTTIGSAFGVACGCIIGMGQLLFMDLDRADRLKRQRELDTIFEMVMSDGPKLFHCERATLFVYDKSKSEIWSKAVFGLDQAIRLNKNKCKSFTTWVLENKEILNSHDANTDYRFNPLYDQKYKYKTRSVLAAPVVDRDGEVMAVLMFINKYEEDGGVFTPDDERMMEMMCKHVQIFMERYDYGAAEDKRMISLQEDEQIPYHPQSVKDSDLTSDELQLEISDFENSLDNYIISFTSKIFKACTNWIYGDAAAEKVSESLSESELEHLTSPKLFNVILSHLIPPFFKSNSDHILDHTASPTPHIMKKHHIEAYNPLLFGLINSSNSPSIDINGDQNLENNVLSLSDVLGRSKSCSQVSQNDLDKNNGLPESEEGNRNGVSSNLQHPPYWNPNYPHLYDHQHHLTGKIVEIDRDLG